MLFSSIRNGPAVANGLADSEAEEQNKEAARRRGQDATDPAAARSSVIQRGVVGWWKCKKEKGEEEVSWRSGDRKVMDESTVGKEVKRIVT